MPKPDLITDSALSPKIQDLIRQVVSRTRLWKRERHSLTLELLAHFHDGLEAGRSAEDLIKTFGDPKLTATLVRRAKKRNRPLWWHFARRTLQVIGIFILLYLGQMAILLTGRPEIKVDYAAQICEKANAVPQADRAWPIYRDAWQADPPWKITWSTKPPRPFVQSFHNSKPGDPTWGLTVAFLQQHSGLLEAARAGAAKPGLGITLRERRDANSDYRKMFPLQPSAHAIFNTADNSIMVFEETSALSSMIMLLQADIQLAAEQRDPARIVEDYRAITGLCRQIREVPTLIGQLVSLIRTRAANESLANLIARSPDLLSSQQYLKLVRIMPPAQEVMSASMKLERVWAQDLMQRLYTDDGNGDGRLTPLAAEAFIMQGQSGKRPHLTTALSLPLLSACLASRREITQIALERYDAVERESQRPLREILQSPSASPTADEFTQKLSSSMTARIHYWPLSVIIPQFTNVGKDVYTARALHDALSVALALEAFRKDTGAYPKTLNELIPHYLPAIPTDPLANQPLLYTLHNGKPTIYAPGQDGQNRGGAPTNKSPFEIPTAADWILFPPPNP